MGCVIQTLEGNGGTAMGPEWFLDCPISVPDSRDWLIRLWNAQLLPTLAATSPVPQPPFPPQNSGSRAVWR